MTSNVELANLWAYQNQFCPDSTHAHLNNAGLARISKPARDCLLRWAELFFRDGFATDGVYKAEVLLTRQRLAHLIGCQAGDIAFFTNPSSALSQLAFGLKWNASSEIVVFDQEYPSNLYPWLTLQRRDSGVKLHQVPSGTNLGVPREPFLSLLNERTRLVSLSWVQFQTGARLDIPSWSREIRKRAPQALIVVDAMQGLGLHPMSWADWDVDALVGGSYKWLTSPVGVAFLVVKPDLLEKLEPILIGSATFGTCDDAFSTVCSPKTDASRFESGSKQSLDIMALGASLEMILQCGVQTIEKEALRLADRLRAGLIDLGCTLHSPELTDGPSAIVNFSGPVSVERIAEAFDREKVLFARRGPGLRLSPGAFTKDREIDLALSTIQAIGD